MVLYGVTDSLTINYGIAQLSATLEVPPLSCNDIITLPYSEVHV